MLSATPWLLVFDLDGTLIDSSLDLCLAVNAALEHVGSPQLPHDMIAGYIGDGAAMLMRRALGDVDRANLGNDEQQRFERAFRHFLSFYRVHMLDNTRLYEGALGALNAMRNASPDVLMAILTNKPVQPSRDLCNALGLAPFFFVNYGGDSFESKKPNPLGLSTIIEQARAIRRARGLPTLALQLANVWMVGDSETDVFTARSAGVSSLGCRYGLSPHSLEHAKPNLLCRSPAEWPSLLGFSAPCS